MLHITLPLHHFTTLDLTATLRHKAMPKQYETGPYLYFVIPNTTITSLAFVTTNDVVPCYPYSAAIYFAPPVLHRTLPCFTCAGLYFSILRVVPLHRYNITLYRNTNVLNLTATISHITSPIPYLLPHHYTNTANNQT